MSATKLSWWSCDTFGRKPSAPAARRNVAVSEIANGEVVQGIFAGGAATLVR